MPFRDFIQICSVLIEELPFLFSKFRKHRGTRDQIANICWIIERAMEFQKNIYFCFIDYTKTFDSVDHKKNCKILKRWECQTTLPVSWKPCMQFKKQQLEPDMEKFDRFKLEKGAQQCCLLSPAYLTGMKSTSCEMLAGMNHKLEPRVLREIPTTSDMQVLPG